MTAEEAKKVEHFFCLDCSSAKGKKAGIPHVGSEESKLKVHNAFDGDN